MCTDGKHVKRTRKSLVKGYKKPPSVLPLSAGYHVLVRHHTSVSPLRPLLIILKPPCSDSVSSSRHSPRLSVDVHLGRPAAVPGGEQHAAAAALVGHVLHAVHDVGDASEAGEAAEAESPGTTETTLANCSPTNFASGIRFSTYCVVFPVSNAQLVMLRCPHAGQSAGAGPRPRLAMGVAFW